jgi:hypothetical protein
LCSAEAAVTGDQDHLSVDCNYLAQISSTNMWRKGL